MIGGQSDALWKRERDSFVQTVLVKVGGSLLTLPDLGKRLRTMFTVIPADSVMVVVGGGAATDVVRDWDILHDIGEDASHWLAIDSMSLTARLLANILPEVVLVSDRQSAEECICSGRIAVLDPRPIIEELNREAVRQLPVGWECTSDSIAGWIANQLGADAVVLAKSVDAPCEGLAVGDDGAVGSARSRAVDRCFESVIAGQLPVHWCNLRDSPGSVVVWQTVTSDRGEVSD